MRTNILKFEEGNEFITTGNLRIMLNGKEAIENEVLDLNPQEVEELRNSKKLTPKKNNNKIK